MGASAVAVETAPSVESVIARLERLPISRELAIARIVIGSATFFDAYTVLAIAYAMPVLAREWNLTPGQIGTIISSGYLGQVFGALLFGWLAERIGRLNVLLITVVIFTSMDLACLFAWNAFSMMAFRFLQGIGTGGEVPVASAYMNEFVSAKRRGRFFLLYEVLFLFGLLAAGLIGYFLVPVYGWRAMFVVGLVPAILTIPMRWFMVESPRWLLSVGRTQQASDLVARMENGFQRRGISLETPIVSVHPLDKAKSDIRELFKGMYFRRTVLLTALWVCSYMIANGLITWLPTLYRQIFQLPLQTSLAYGFATSALGCAAALFCALYIDKVGRKIWYTLAFFLAAVPMVLLAVLGAVVGATSSHLRHGDLRSHPNSYVLSLPLLGRTLSDPPARCWRGLWKCMAAYRVGHWTVVGRMGGGKLQHQLRVRRVRDCPRNWRDHLPFVCARNQGSRSRRNVALNPGGIKKMNA